jgi:uncharacterized HAD superfamily protein
VLGCDLDGVIGDIVQQIVRFSRREHRISMTKKHIVSEDIETCAPIRREQLHELFKNREFFRSLPMVPHAREALLQLKTAGCEIHVVTDRFWYAGIQEDTKEWLTQRRIPFDSLVFARKSAKHDVADHLGIEWFIEDQLSNARLLAPLCQVLLVNRPYNQGGIPDHVTRVEDLRRAVTVILGAMKVSESNGQPQRMALRCPA